jgi:UDP-N-acetylglucosamine:LPS N-acetylglucosamine transferase
MGSLLARADVAITRGGTTSLAEQQLFNIHKIIVPIPRTHDQTQNAQYYVHHHGDCIVLQSSSTYKTDLATALYHVTQIKKDIFPDPRFTIEETKRSICRYLLFPSQAPIA